MTAQNGYYLYAKTVGKGTRILHEIEKNKEIRRRMNFLLICYLFYIMFIYYITVLEKYYYLFFYSLCLLRIADLG